MDDNDHDDLQDDDGEEIQEVLLRELEFQLTRKQIRDLPVATRIPWEEHL